MRAKRFTRPGLVALLLWLSASLPGRAGVMAGGRNPIAEGYGADGPYEVVVDTVRGRFMAHRTVYVYRPAVGNERFPVVFFFAGFAVWKPCHYDHLLRHVASRGNCVVFPSYLMIQFPHQSRTYNLIYAGARAGVKACRPHIDTTRLGFIGHSFGGSAFPMFMSVLVKRRGWGSRGAYVHIMAPFYMYLCPTRRLRSFPSQVKLLVEVFEDDDCNDHRMAKDLFETIGIPPAEKDFVVLRSDTCPGTERILWADHATPFGDGDPEGEVDVLDWYGIFRLHDALAEYAFTGNAAAKDVALGSGSAAQRFMGTWPDSTPVRECVVADDAPLLRPRSQFYFHWKHPWNLRRRWRREPLDDPWEKRRE
jgi:hypothetical protein